MSTNVREIYQNLRGNFLVIGLAGSVGSGCTTSARILAGDDSEIGEVLRHAQDDSGHQCLQDSFESKRVERIRKFYQQEKWEGFFHIQVSSLICALIFGDDDFQGFYEDLNLSDWLRLGSNGEARLVSAARDFLGRIDNSSCSSGGIAELLKGFDSVISECVDKKSPSYIKVFQDAGESLRDIGKVHRAARRSSDVPNVFAVSEVVRRVIKILFKCDGVKLFAIDALRNTYEIQFFKNRYSNFYLFSVSADESTRRRRVMGNFQYKVEDYERLRKRESDDKDSAAQNINSCIGLGDVFLENSRDDQIRLKYQIYKYVALLRKPGLFTPTDDERNMQIALTARYNSGCISRQVGACVVGEAGYILGVGWNDVQEGNTPCLYRSPADLLASSQDNISYSEYEKSDEFKLHLTSCGMGACTDPFCFKDQRNNIEATKSLKGKLGDDYLGRLEEDADQYGKLLKIFKNPTRERALHAEENAFLQAAKVGGASIVGSTLYTTASPCQLCAKKSMQLKVKRVVYIDAYPDISQQQTLQSGPRDQWPKLDMFTGVGESAFMKLFKPIIPIKEEIAMLDKESY